MAALIANPLIAPVLPAELSYASPAIRTRPPTLFAPDPPLSRARRSDGSSSDESLRPGPDGFEETDLRAGGPRLPESPCETTETLPRIYWNHDLFQGHGSYVLDTQLRNICQRKNVQPISMRFCGRRSVYEPATSITFTLLVVARRDQSQGSWISLARKLSNHLRGQGLQGLNVEITDPKFSERPKIHPCLPTDAIFPIWTQVGTDIFDRIDRTGVFTIGCFRIGRDYDLHKCPPTILLGVDKNVRRDWRDLREAVISILDRYNLTAVAVAIRKDNKTTRDGQPGNQDPGARREHCRLDPKMGASISPRTAHDSNGTLGGWVEVKAPTSGEWLPFALTCSHCCFPVEEELSEEDLKVIREWKDRGVNQRDAHRARLLPVDSPSYRDMKKGLKSITADIEAQKSKPPYQEVENLRREDGFIVPYKESIWRTISKIIRAMEGDQTHMTESFNSKSHHLGMVFAASGEREMQSTDDPTKLSIRDWALVQPTPSRRAGENTMTPPSTGPGAGWEKLTRLQTDIPGSGDTLLKVGRATGHTPGTYGGLRTCNIVKKIINGKRVDVKTWEHVMLRTGDKATGEGDEGSLVFNDYGGVLGMIFGGSGDYDLGYFTATRDLLADIQLITGLKDVRLCGEE